VHAATTIFIAAVAVSYGVQYNTSLPTEYPRWYTGPPAHAILFTLRFARAFSTRLHRAVVGGRPVYSAVAVDRPVPAVSIGSFARQYRPARPLRRQSLRRTDRRVGTNGNDSIWPINTRTCIIRSLFPTSRRRHCRYYYY